MRELIEITREDDFFDKGEIFWIEWSTASSWVSTVETNKRLAGTSVRYAKYRKLEQDEYPEYFL